MKHIRKIIFAIFIICITFLMISFIKIITQKQDDSYNICMTLAEDYAIKQIPSVIEQQVFLNKKLGVAEFHEENIEFTTARVDVLEYTVEFNQYKIYQFISSYLTKNPEDIICADEWTMNDGWYTDMRPRYLVFTDDKNPQLIGDFFCEFTPDRNSKQFYTDLELWLNEKNVD